jgi:hypothetical protein
MTWIKIWPVIIASNSHITPGVRASPEKRSLSTQRGKPTKLSVPCLVWTYGHFLHVPRFLEMESIPEVTHTQTSLSGHSPLQSLVTSSYCHIIVVLGVHCGIYKSSYNVS